MTVNYAESYSRELANAYPYVLYSGALWSNENTKKYKVVDAKTIKIPLLSTGGRVDGDRTKIGDFSQNFSNEWETKTLTNHRIWQTLVHPQDVNQTNMVASISNITKVMNETKKFPELDAMMFSTIYSLRNAQKAITAETADLTANTVLTKFDAMMDAMDEALVPVSGRVLYCDTYTKTLIDDAIAIVRNNGDKKLARNVSRIEEVDIVSVPTALFKTEYTFNDGKTSGQTDGGFVAKSTAKDIAMILLHPSAILPIVSYSFAQLQPPSALSQGKYVYFEESFEDVFILNKRVDAIQICVKKSDA
nr:MAG TPA: Major capsid protein [Caudoviricetes sp.]